MQQRSLDRDQTIRLLDQALGFEYWPCDSITLNENTVVFRFSWIIDQKMKWHCWYHHGSTGRRPCSWPAATDTWTSSSTSSNDVTLTLNNPDLVFTILNQSDTHSRFQEIPGVPSFKILAYLRIFVFFYVSIMTEIFCDYQTVSQRIRGEFRNIRGRC